MAIRVIVRRPGGYKRLELEEFDLPEPEPGEVQIRVHAAGVNFADCLVRKGLYRSAREFEGWPVTPGFEVSGVVSEVGPAVQGFEAGDEVLAVTLFGGYSSRLNLPSDQIFHRPPALSRVDAAALTTVFITAYYALFELAHPRAGGTLLVHSAAGGVGGALVQLGKIEECTVVGVVGTPGKVETALALGADHVVVRSQGPLWEALEKVAPDGYDVILDAHGARSLRDGYEHLKPPGKLVIYGFHGMLAKGRGRPSWPKLVWEWMRTPRFDPLKMTHQNRSVLAFNLSYLFSETTLLAEVMGRLFAWLEEGRIRPLPVRTFPLEEVAEAHREMEAGGTVGKLVLEM